MKWFRSVLVFALFPLLGNCLDDSQWIDFTPEEWADLERSIDQGLDWLAEQQQPNGMIGPTSSASQPAITALATMAFLSRGHQPGIGPRGGMLQRAVDFVLQTQDQNGFFVTDRTYRNHGTSYGHAISGVMLAEVLGTTSREQNERVSLALRRGLSATYRLQQRHQNDPRDRGGWRYIDRRQPDADLSVTTWHLLFLRAAKNAGFDVPESLVIETSNYVKSCFSESKSYFGYFPGREGTITLTGAGTLCLFLAGQVDDPVLKRGVQSLRDYNFRRVALISWPYYTCYHCSQAASQAGGETRRKVLKEITRALLDEQRHDGSWPGLRNTAKYGRSYSTSLAILSLTPSYQILPIYQQ